MTDIATDTGSPLPNENSVNRNAVFDQPNAIPPAVNYQSVSPLKLMGFAVIAIVAFVWVLTNAINTRFQENSVQQELESLKASLAQGDFKNADGEVPIVAFAPVLSDSERVKAQIAAAERIALNKSAVTSFRDTLSRLKSIVREAESSKTEFSATLDRLASNDSGRRIASDRELLKQIALLQEEVARPDVLNEAANFSAEMTKFLDEADLATAIDFRPSVESIQRLAALRQACEAEKELLDERKLALDTIVSSASENATSETTLHAALQEFALDEQKEMAAKLAARLAKAKSEESAKYAQLLEDAERERIASKSRVELAKISDETRRNLDLSKRLEEQSKADAENAALELEKQRLRAEFSVVRDDVLRHLAPFVGDGMKMRGDNEGRGPVSWSVIQASGALNVTAQGVSKLSQLSHNDRPKNGFPSHIYPGTFNVPEYAGQIAYVEKAQQYLKKYGALMVEDGMLAE